MKCVLVNVVWVGVGWLSEVISVCVLSVDVLVYDGRFRFSRSV